MHVGSVLSWIIAGEPLHVSRVLCLSIYLSPPIPGLQILASWGFLDYQLYILNLRCLLDSAFSFPGLQQATSQGSKLGKPQVHSICFPHLRAHCPSLPDIQYLANFCF